MSTRGLILTMILFLIIGLFLGYSLGNHSKTFIKKVIQSNNPELYSLISNNKKLKEYKNNNNKNESI